jgi:chromosomal replication initiation ATPase DnaA
MLEPYDNEEMSTLRRAYRAGIEDAKRNPEKYEAKRTAMREAYQQQLRDATAKACEAPVDPIQHLRTAGFGNLYLQRLGVGVDVWPAVAAARAWVDQQRIPGEHLPYPFLTLIGPTDCGKTQAAAVAAARWAISSIRPRATSDTHEEVVLLQATELATAGLFGQEAERRLNAARNARFLVLDDFGTEHLTGPFRAELFNFINYRYAHRKRTVLSANMTRLQLEQRLDADVPKGESGRAFRRLSEHGWMAQVSREQGLLWVGGDETKFPDFDMPKRRNRREEAMK